MKKSVRFIRLLAVILLLLTGASAIYAGVLLIAAPDGQLIGLAGSALQFSPFTDFLIPGIILLVIHGILNVIVAFMTIVKTKHYALLIVLQGLLLIGWLIIQVFMLRQINGLHLVMLAVGITLIFCGLFLKRN